MGNQKVKIRKMMEQDMLTVYEQICELEDKKLDFSNFKNIFFINIKDELKLNFVAVNENDTILGFISCHIQELLHHGGKVAEIQELFVSNEYRCNGIGKLLITSVETIVNKMGCLLFEVTAHESRLNAHQFYKKNGLIPTHLKFTKLI